MAKQKTPPDPPPSDAGPEDQAPSLEDLAKRYLDLWQDQWLAVSQDPQFADAMSRMAQAFTPPPGTAAPAGFAGAFGDGKPSPWPQWPHGWPVPPGASTPSGTKAAGPASGHGAGGSAELAQRVAALEKRLAALETSTRTARKRTAATPRKR